ncbi:MAG: P-loop NTPase fold protein [Candidatus Methanofastidiosia archaeon]|jgi:predicted KAP-like P-loop ATPase
MLSDKETDIDALGFEPYANSLSEFIVEKGITPFTIGIFGSWGSGKTSLMLMLKKKLESKYNVKTVWFNAWKFDDEKQIWTALIQTILNCLEPSLGWRSKRKIKKLRDSIEWVQVATFLNNSMISGKPDINSLRKCFKPKQKIESISKFEEKFGKIVDACNVEKLVMFIDDLDRCKMDATVEILETIKLLLNSKKCVYVLGLDYERVRHAVSEKFAESSKKVAEDYLDKIIQLYFHIPRRTEDDMKIYLRYLFALKYLRKKSVQDFSKDIRRIGDDIDGEFLKILREYIDIKDFHMDKYKTLTEFDLLIIKGNEFNPRKIKRFLNIYEMRISLSKLLELDLRNEYLIKFLLLQTAFSDFYRDLEDNPDLLEQINKLSILDKKEREKELEKFAHLKKYNLNKIFKFFNGVSFEDIDPLPYLRIAQTVELRTALGEKEKRTLDNLISGDDAKIDQGVDDFHKLNEDQKEIVVRNLLERTGYDDAQVRRKSVRILGLLRGDIHGDLIENVVRQLVELTEDENGRVRNQAKNVLEI